MDSLTIGLLEEILEYLEPRMDADGGPNGYTPNEEMSLYIQVEEEINRLKRQERNSRIGEAKTLPIKCDDGNCATYRNMNGGCDVCGAPCL